jgi:hypothetical protein
MNNEILPFSTIFAPSVMKIITMSKLLLLATVLGFLATNVVANEDTDEALESSIEALKKEVLSLNRDLFILEEDLLFPANTQFSIFLSMNAGQLFTLDSVQLRIDDKNIANHLYTERELAALSRGGVQRLYIGNLPSGEHEIVAVFTGVGPKGRDYRRGKTILVDKTTEPQFIEFTIEDDASKEQPIFNARVWE